MAAPRIWWLPQPGLQTAIDVLTTRDLRVEMLPEDPKRPGPQFLARRGRVAQRCTVWEWEGREVVDAFYRLTWPWRAEIRLIN